MKHKRKSLLRFVALAILLLCGMTVANAQTPQEIAQKALDATVLLVMKDANGRPLGFGSGFFVQPNQIATNFHVIEGAARGTAKRVGLETEYNIEGFTAIDKKNDLAIVQVSVSGINPLPVGDSDTVEIGDKVYVAGNPKRFEGTFSNGTISGIRGSSTNKRLQMTAPISPGSSGGPVLNGKGKVIGVSVMTIEGGQNLNFAIPSNYLSALIARLDPVKPLSVRKQPVSAETYLKWGNTKCSLGQYRAAIAAYDTAIRLKPDYTKAYVNRGLTKGLLKQYTSAIADFNTAVRLKPDDARAYAGRGLVKNDLGRYRAAIADFDKAIELNPDFVHAYGLRGHTKSQLQQYFAAIADFDKVISLEPDAAHAYVSRGMAKESLGQYFAAITDYNKAIELNPDFAWAYNKRGSAKYRLGQHRAAIADYDIAIRLKPEEVLTHVSRGMAKYRLGHTRAAKLDFTTALKLAKQAGDERLKAFIEETIRDLY